jgi:hypothetical protein
MLPIYGHQLPRYKKGLTPGNRAEALNAVRHFKESGWGTWIRTKTARVRVGSSTVKLFPNGVGGQIASPQGWCKPVRDTILSSGTK